MIQKKSGWNLEPHCRQWSTLKRTSFVAQTFYQRHNGGRGTTLHPLIYCTLALCLVHLKLQIINLICIYIYGKKYTYNYASNGSTVFRYIWTCTVVFFSRNPFVKILFSDIQYLSLFMNIYIV